MYSSIFIFQIENGLIPKKVLYIKIKICLKVLIKEKLTIYFDFYFYVPAHRILPFLQKFPDVLVQD